MSIFKIDCAEQQIRFCRCGKVRDKAITLGVFIAHRFRQRALRPNQQIGRRICAQRDLAQSGEFLENFVREFGIGFFPLRNVGLDCRDVERFCR